MFPFRRFCLVLQSHPPPNIKYLPVESRDTEGAPGTFFGAAGAGRLGLGVSGTDRHC
jgi:hypothetical protein